MLSVGQHAPEFYLYGADGGRHGLRALIEKGPLLLFFVRSTTCSFCQGELRKLAQEYATLKDAGLSLAGVVTEARARAERWAREENLPYLLLADEERGVARMFGVYKALGFDSFRMAQPSSFIVDRDGVIRFARLIKEENMVPSLAEYLDVARSLGEATPKAAARSTR